MKLAWVKQIPKPLIAGFFGLAIGLVPAAAGASQPYFKAFGADVMAGGWFKSGTSCNNAPSGPYQEPNYSAAPDQRAGGIMTYVNTTKGGASSQYGAFALGQVEGNPGNNYGFYSAGNLGAQKALTFANTTGWGGFYEGSILQANCIPDYYNQKLALATTQPANSGSFPGASGAYTGAAAGATPFSVNSSDVTIAAGAKITLFVKGNVYIGHNISYASDTADNATKFSLIALGNIYIDPAVTRLDGLYIAQPATSTVSADDGAIWTCHPNNNANPLTSDYILASCGNKLTINGALIAKQVNFLRINGDVSSASGGEESVAGANASGNIAEIINYIPEMVVGGPFFNSNSNTSLKVESLVNLPPVF